MHEFEIIQTFFNKKSPHRPEVVLGIGDDAAIVSVPAQQQLVITTDTLVAGVHFFAETAAADLGYKSLAVNLSDLAAMGATPAWITLALTIPTNNEPWLKDFSAGFFELAKQYQMQLIGGDLTHGPLAITIQAMGLVPADKALTRSGAKTGDLIYVSNYLGDAGIAVRYLQKEILIAAEYQQKFLQRLQRPEPRIKLGEKLRGIANACIDISDGLAADLGHILEMSKVGARIDVEGIPFSEAMLATVTKEQAIDIALNSGDDYELCFTVPTAKKAELENIAKECGIKVTAIGVISDEPGLILQFADGKKYHGTIQGYQHF